MPDLAAVHDLTVIGLGRSGHAAALLALRELPGVTLTVVDSKEAESLGAAPDELRSAGAALSLGPGADLPPRVDLVVKSPGVPNEAPPVAEALHRGVPVWSEVEFASRFLPEARFVAITGTNGKTTTTELTGAILRGAGAPVAVAGNVGLPLASLPGTLVAGAVIVAELSSFQLEHIERFRPAVAVLLNLTEDHIDRHGTLQGYAAAKSRVFENQMPDDLALLNGDDAGSRDLAVAGQARRGTFSIVDEAVAGGERCGGAAGTLFAGVRDATLWYDLGEGRHELCAIAELALRGDHNVANSLAAAVAAAAVGVPAGEIARTLRTFAGVPHRLQVVATAGGVTYVNDSKATNVDAALKALTAYSGPVYMILGGSLKGAAFDELAAATEGHIREALLIGAAAEPLREAFERRRRLMGERATPFTVLPDMEAAVGHAAGKASPGDVVLLSPACASFDQYRNFEHRGEHFSELVMRIVHDKTRP